MSSIMTFSNATNNDHFKMNQYLQSRALSQKTNSPGHDPFNESDSCIEGLMSDEFSFMEPFPIETAHERLIESLNRFLPTSNNVKINFKSIGHYSVVLKKTAIDITFRDDVPKILLSTTVHQRVHNNLMLSSPPKGSRSRHYSMLTAMMKLKTMLDRSEGMDSITSVNGKFIYYQEVDFEILQESTRLHRILEGFILRSYEIRQDFNRISKMIELPERSFA